ncbi:MAG: hypothetical protein N2C14_29490, partial [Planctomycetales bacterium]
MARRKRRKTQPGVSLFPFLSILACVIGVLTLMITAMALGQMEPTQVKEAQQRAQQLKEINQQFHQSEGQRNLDQPRLDKLQKQLAHAEATRKQLEQARKELAEFKNLPPPKTKKPKDASDEDRLLLAEADRLRKRIDELKMEIPGLGKTLQVLEAQLAERRRPPDEAQVKVQPGGSGFQLKPTFVECVPGSVVIFEGGKEIRVRTGDLEKSTEFAAALDRVKARK